MKRNLVIFLGLLVFAIGLFAQNKGAIIIQCNVSGAQVLLNDRLIGNTTPNFSTLLLPGTYKVTVRKQGFPEYVNSVALTEAGVILQVVLGGAPTVREGDFDRKPPRPSNYDLSIASNIAGAVVFINGNQAGRTPFAAQVPPGSYAVIVRAPGYLDFSQNVVVNGPQAVNVALQPMFASWQLNLPESMRVRDKPNQSRGFEFWIDGVQQPVSAGQISAGGQLPAGSHVIRLVSGGMAAETQVDLQAGRTYTFEPFIGINVK